jgi:hypothetical protein
VLLFLLLFIFIYLNFLIATEGGRHSATDRAYGELTKDELRKAAKQIHPSSVREALFELHVPQVQCVFQLIHLLAFVSSTRSINFVSNVKTGVLYLYSLSGNSSLCLLYRCDGQT